MPIADSAVENIVTRKIDRLILHAKKYQKAKNSISDISLMIIAADHSLKEGEIRSIVDKRWLELKIY